jgi:hypothetical protein
MRLTRLAILFGLLSTLPCLVLATPERAAAQEVSAAAKAATAK